MSIATNSNFGLLSNNPLPSRTINIDRKVSTSSTWTLNWKTLTTSGATSGNNWSYAFSESPAATTSYNYRIHYASATGVDGNYSPTITLTFRKPCIDPTPPR